MMFDADRTTTSLLPSSQFPFVDKYAQEQRAGLRDTVVRPPEEGGRTGNDCDRLSQEKEAYILVVLRWSTLWHRDKGGFKGGDSVMPLPRIRTSQPRLPGNPGPGAMSIL